MKDTMPVDKQATDLCICSWAALQTYQQVWWSPVSTLEKHKLLAELRLYLQKSHDHSNQLHCAVLTADSVSWFQLLNSTTVKPLIPSIIDGSSGKQCTAHNALTQQDSKWLDTALTKVFCTITAHLHVYGADSAVNQSPGPTQPELFKPAITSALAAVKDSLCGASAVLLASPSGQGTVTTARSACNAHSPQLGCADQIFMTPPSTRVIRCRACAVDPRWTQKAMRGPSIQSRAGY